jgi:hypothetical protein
MATTPLAVLDLVPITSGSTAAQALRNSLDLARQAEHFGGSGSAGDRRATITGRCGSWPLPKGCRGA